MSPESNERRRVHESPPAGLYLHVPFCSQVCPYCDFAVLKGSAAQRRSFADLVGLEMDLVVAEGWHFDTIYLGGGTPSAVEASCLATILERLRATYALAPETVLSLEANPEDVDDASCARWRDLGVSTLSLGVQSFDDQSLAFLGRRHDAEEARRAVEIALEAGFPVVSLDLIYGFPDEARGCEAGFWRSLEAAIALRPQHLSCYQLTIHRGTAFGRRRELGELREMSETRQASDFLRLHRELGCAGYEAYEVSNFAARREHRSRHNQKYWRHVPYIGLGPSAHTFDGRARFWNEPRLAVWTRRLREGRRPLAGSECLTPADLALEAVMLALRTRDGLDTGAFERRFGVPLLDLNADLVRRLVDDGRLQLDDERLRPTTLGMAIADSMAAAFHVGL